MIAPFVDAGWLRAHRADVVLADVRWYLDGRSGRTEFEAGHIPGARNLPAREMLDGDGRLLAGDALRAQLDRAGVTAGGDVVASCGSGVTACHTLLVLEALGVPGRLFPGSYSQWSHTDRPVRRTGA
jgi:thiosulfate/3-mercaptopyruvate sulfurtransferase